MGPMVSSNESNQLKRCLKTGLHIINQNQYISFKHALFLGKLQSLKSRRLKLQTSFGKKAQKSEKHENWFVTNNCESPNDVSRTRHKKPPPLLLKPVPCRTRRFERSTPLHCPVCTVHATSHHSFKYNG